MRRNQKLLCLFVLFFFTFIAITFYYMTVLSTVSTAQQNALQTKYQAVNNVEILIKNSVNSLPNKYKTSAKNEDNHLDNFIKNTKYVGKTTASENTWQVVKSGIVANRIYSIPSDSIGFALNALRNVTIKSADIDSRGSQLKLLFTLTDGQLAVFKPQWYRINRIITGPVYSGKDRYNAEILAFYLAGILDFCSVPFTVERSIHLEKEIIPVASDRLKATIDKRNESWCVYGVCHYCRPTEPACSYNGFHLRGALIWHLPKKLQMHRSPWRRKYRGSELALWQVQSNYCQAIKTTFSQNRLLDLMDAAVFDFLMQNGDRHHYETVNGKLVLIDNGKGLGNPKIHHLDILAPLYQCCILKSTTWNRLVNLSGGKLLKVLREFPDVVNSVTEEHLLAIEERLLLIYTTVELCFSRYTRPAVLK